MRGVLRRDIAEEPEQRHQGWVRTHVRAGVGEPSHDQRPMLFAIHQAELAKDCRQLWGAQAGQIGGIGLLFHLELPSSRGHSYNGRQLAPLQWPMEGNWTPID